MVEQGFAGHGSHRVGTVCVECERIDKRQVGQREQEARDIARAEGYPIIGANEDWTFFTLDDAQVVPAGTWYAGQLLKGSWTIRTHFAWSEGRFEGFVS